MGGGRFARIAGLLAAAGGAWNLLGWLLDRERIRSFGLESVTMKANAGLSFFLLGAALALASPSAEAPRARRISRILSALVAALGAVTLLEYALGVDLGIDQLLAREHPGAVGTVIPGRMAPSTALAFFFLGAGTMLVNYRTRRGMRPSDFFALAAGIGAWVAFLSYLHGVPRFFGLEKFTPMAVPTILCLLLLSCGLFFARPDRGLASFLTTRRSEGRFARIFLPACLLLPALLGGMFAAGEKMGFFEARFGADLLAAAASLLILIIAFGASRLILRRDDMFLATFEQAAVGIAHVALDGRYRLVNEKFCSIAGYAKDEILRMTYQELTHPDDRAADEKILREFREGSRREAVVEKRVPRKDGGVVWVRLTASLARTPAGEPGYFITVVEDVTERRRLEAERRRLGTAIEQTHEIVMITDAEGRIEYVNPAFERVTGYARSEAVGRNARFLASGRHPREFYRSLWGKLHRGERWSGTFLNRRKDGSEYEEEAVISPVRDAEGRATHFVAVKRDTTPDREAARARTAATRETERADRAEAQFQQAQKMESIGRLAGGVAHDFNNLLTVIQTNVEILLEDAPARTEDREMLEEIREGAARAAGLTRQLLAFSRRQVLAPRVLDPNRIVEETERMIRRLVGEDISLRTKLAFGIGRIRADSGQIEQVILNLVVNARDAMPRGGWLSLETANVELDAEFAQEHPETTPGSYVLLSVSDSGVGMDAATQARIFEPFYTTKELGKGTGLGLSTVYGIVKQSGGHIWVSSAPGKGTTFRIYFPRIDAPVEPSRATAEGIAPRGHETILLVEDEIAVRAAARRALERSGYVVLEAADGEAAILLFLKHKDTIALLVTDVVMPRISGPELAAKFTSARPGLKVLYVSGYTEDGIVHHGVLDPGIQFLQKPFTGELLGRKVRETLEG